MTDPLTDELDGEPTAPVRRVVRELVGLLLVVLGAVALCVLLATVDWRLGVGLAALACMGIGLWMGSGSPDNEGD